MESTSDGTSNDVQNISREEPILPGPQDASLERHRNMMLASLLEDYYKTRAMEFLNNSNPGENYTRTSPEVQDLARRLFEQAGQVLSSNNWIPSVAISDDSQSLRTQYLAGLDRLAGSQTMDIVNSMRNIALSHPTNDLQLATRPPPAPRSHYAATFREDCLLGRGGFGKVYKCYNFLDQKTYAVKKIVLPRKLVKSLCDKKHEDLHEILVEVKAMAMLEHPNIVRYHATWFEEEPDNALVVSSNAVNQSRRTRHPLGPRRLLINSPDDESESSDEEVSLTSSDGGIVFENDTEGGHEVSAPFSDGGIVFAEDTVENPNAAEPSNRGRSEDGDASDLSITDGSSSSQSEGLAGADHEKESPPALYIQMSMYPMTLRQFIKPRADDDTGLRHCFHLVPTLRLLLPILDGLQYIHAKGLIHRDIKPGNLFLSLPLESTIDKGSCDLSCKLCADSEKGEARSPSVLLNPRIGDFGLVHQLAHGEVPETRGSPSSSSKEVGTPFYLPPRKSGKDKEKKDEKIDIFALGVVFLEMLCRFETAMERVEMRTDLEKGKIPQNLKKMMIEEGHDNETVQDVMELASAMVELESEKRWSGNQVRIAMESLLSKCQE
ncbi:kinase-like protein [Xylariaceae sp. FL0255]|nr:kinase-like protein [Xylariaceae sp. FL0255]